MKLHVPIRLVNSEQLSDSLTRNSTRVWHTELLHTVNLVLSMQICVVKPAESQACQSLVHTKSQNISRGEGLLHAERCVRAPLKH